MIRFRQFCSSKKGGKFILKEGEYLSRNLNTFLNEHDQTQKKIDINIQAMQEPKTKKVNLKDFTASQTQFIQEFGLKTKETSNESLFSGLKINQISISQQKKKQFQERFKNKQNQPELKPIQTEINSISDFKNSMPQQHLQKAIKDIIKPYEQQKIRSMAYEGEKSSNIFQNQLMPYNKMPEYKYFDEPLEKGSMEIGEWRREIQFQQDMKRLKEFKMKPYPGSQKGPLPEDDPQHYQSWFIENMPQDLLPYFRQEKDQSDEDDIMEGKVEFEAGDGENVEFDLMDQCDLIEDALTVSNVSVLQGNLGIQKTVASETMDVQFFKTKSDVHLSSQHDSKDLSIYPPKHDLEWNRAQENFEKWSIFRTFPVIDEIRAKMSNQQWVKEAELKPLPSLFSYYNLLPEFARTHPVVTQTLRCLEFRHHDMTMKQKELALNYACQFTLPMDKLTASVMIENLHPKFEILGHEEDQFLFDKDPEGKEKNVFADVTYKPRAIKEADKQKGNMNWNTPDPIDMHNPSEMLGDELPLDFYDNDDGFWTEYIKKKEEVATQVDVIFARPYFKH